nr:MAG TPA: hypothetical protein [Caudoviricetes sp.]
MSYFFNLLIASRIASAFDICFSSQYSFNILLDSLSNLTVILVSFGLSVGLPIFAALITSPHLCLP